MGFLKGTNFDDGLVRTFVKDFFNVKFNTLLSETPHEMKLIDLTGATETLLGVEVERGGWSDCFWNNERYSLISGIGEKTANIPIRKEKYWKENYLSYRKEKNNPSCKENIFARTNKDFTQILIIRPETIRDPQKLIRTNFKPNNSDVFEDWLSFKREDVETYNLINEEWILDNGHEIQ